MKKFLPFIIIALLLAVPSQAQEKITPHDIDWPAFLRQHDMVWDTIAADYYAGAIMGNGLLGNNIYKQGSGYKFHVGRVDVTEGRMPENKYEYRNLYHGARLPIGYFLLTPVGTVADENMRLSLWDAVTTGEIVTDKGRIALKSYVHATQDVIVVETETEGAERDFRWEWTALRAISPRYVHGRDDYPQEYIDTPNPEVKIFSDGDYGLSVQNLVGGMTYVVAWRETKDGDSRRILMTISHEPTERTAIDKAKATLDRAFEQPRAGLEKSHKEWWHGYYPASFASFGDAKMESFYWIQQYKFACLTRPDKHVIDLQGPWAVESTPWPAIWMNLNIQLTYSPLFTANRAEMSRPVWRALSDNLHNLVANTTIEEWQRDALVMGRSTSYHMFSPLHPDMENPMLYEPGNLLWLLYHYYEYCTYSGDGAELLDRFYPMLAGSVRYYEYIREKREDGLWHLPRTASPEYAAARNCNYDLAVLRWGLNTLLELNEAYALNDPRAAAWQDFKDNLVDYPIDPERGFMIGEGVNLESSHRHYSHLLMIYPFYEVNWEQPENRELIARSIAHWQSMPQALQGYSFTGSSSMYSMMGDGERAVGQLHTLIDRYVQPNTLYREGAPVIETPLAGATSLQELYLQSWGGKIRVFPAVPDHWPQASFIDLRAPGAFLISAARDGGRTMFIQIGSEKGGECLVQTGMDTDNLLVQKIGDGAIDLSVVDKATGLIRLNTMSGDVILLTATDAVATLPQPVQHPAAGHNRYGVRR